MRSRAGASTPHVDGRAGVRPTVGARCDEIRLRQGSASDDAEHITQHGDPEEDRPEEQHIVDLRGKIASRVEGRRRWLRLELTDPSGPRYYVTAGQFW
jgi:hypothetical protein